MEDTLDNALAPIEESINKAKTYSADSMVNNDVAELKMRDGDIVHQVDHGNGVATFRTESKRVAQTLFQDLGYEVSDFMTDAAEGMGYEPTFAEDVTEKIGPIEAITIGAFEAKKYFENKMHDMHPQTELGKNVRDIGTELMILFGTVYGLGKFKALQGVPKYGQKAKKYFTNLAKSAMRWGFAEGVAAGIARDNESEPFALMITDITGITDKEDLQHIRLMYQDALNNGDDYNNFRLRAVKALDGLATGIAIESLLTVLGSTYKAHQALMGTNLATSGSVGAAVTAEQLTTQEGLIDINNDKLIQQLFPQDLRIDPFDE